MKTSWINTTVFMNEATGKIENRTYEWVGKSPYVEISWRIIQDMFTFGDDNSKIQIGPYKLVQVEHHLQTDSILYVRKDRLWKLYIFLYRSIRLLDLKYRRIIITLGVLRLADVHSNRIPSWEDIVLIKKIIERRRK